MRLQLLCIALAFAVGHCKKFTPTGLAQEMKRLGVSDWDIPTLVCIAYNTSALDTQYVGRREMLHYTYYGIFGIPDALFDAEACDHMTKVTALDDDIDDDVKCVRNLIKKEGSSFFLALPESRTDKLGLLTPHDVDISKCFDWWESLPSFTDAIESKKLVDKPDMHVCKCSCGAGMMSNVLLFILDVTLIGLACLAWMAFRRQKGIGYFHERINNTPMI